MLIKAAAQAIPSYCMSTFLFPSTLLDELHRMLNSFGREIEGMLPRVLNGCLGKEFV